MKKLGLPTPLTMFKPSPSKKYRVAASVSWQKLETDEGWSPTRKALAPRVMYGKEREKNTRSRAYHGMYHGIWLLVSSLPSNSLHFLVHSTNPNDGFLPFYVAFFYLCFVLASQDTRFFFTWNRRLPWPLEEFCKRGFKLHVLCREKFSTISVLLCLSRGLRDSFERAQENCEKQSMSQRLSNGGKVPNRGSCVWFCGTHLGEFKLSGCVSMSYEDTNLVKCSHVATHVARDIIMKYSIK